MLPYCAESDHFRPTTSAGGWIPPHARAGNEKPAPPGSESEINLAVASGVLKASQAMKLLTLLLGIVMTTAHGSEIVTLNSQNQSVTVNESDVVQVLTVIAGSSGRYLVIDMPGITGGARPYLFLSTQANEPRPDHKNAIFTGATKVSLAVEPTNNTEIPGNDRLLVTLRITRAADTVFSEPVVMPAVTDQNYTVELQTSTDLTDWIPAVPGDYLGGATNRFFRVKVEAKPD